MKLSNTSHVSITLFLASLIATSQSPAAPGSLDTSFNSTGFVIAGGGPFCCIAQQSDGSLVVAGTQVDSGNGDFSVRGYSANGSSSWSVRTNIGAASETDDSVKCMALQTNGRIIVAGSSLVRYDLGGGLDATFDGDGKVNTNGLGTILGVALQADGKILAVGALLARYNTNGSLDTSFNSTGIRTDISGYSIAVQPDQKFVIMGGGGGHALQRYNPDGSLDASFDGAGNDVGLRAFVLQGDGKVVVVGCAGGTTPGSDWGLMRFNEDGTRDGGFGNGGRVTTDLGNFEEHAQSVALQSDWKIVVAGPVSTFGIGEYWALARYNYDGSLDTSFGNGGKVVTTLGQTGASALGVTVQRDGRIAAVGWAGPASATVARFEGGPFPDITVEQPAGTAPANNSTIPVAFPPVVLGSSGSLTFTVRNQGGAELRIPTSSKAATGTPGDFTIGPLSAATLAPNASTTFTVTFSPTGAGARTATLLIASNDEDESPFEINITGRQATPLEAWRQSHFGSPFDAGAAADLNDPDGDGIANL